MRSYETNVYSKSQYFMYTPTEVAKKLYFYPTIIGHFYYTDKYSIKRNKFSNYLMMLIVDGSLKVEINRKEYFAKKGEIVFIDCKKPHKYQSVGEWESLWVHFDGVLADDYYNQLTKDGIVIEANNYGSLEYYFNDLVDLFKNQKTIDEANVSKKLISILTELLKNDHKNIKEDKESLMNDIITYINENFSKSITIDDLSKMAKLSTYYFVKVFSKEIGLTPHQYITQVRLNTAKFLLATTNLSIKAIGYDIGFKSETSFCITFKKWEKLTPSEYRLSTFNRD